MGDYRAANDVRGHVQACTCGAGLDYPRNAFRAQSPRARKAYKKRSLLRVLAKHPTAPFFEVNPQGRTCRPGKRHHSVTRSLALDMHEAGPEVDGFEIQPGH